MNATKERQAIREKLNKHKQSKKEKKAASGADRGKAKLARLNEKYVAKYPHFVSGSLCRTDGSTKLGAEIACVDCGAKRGVYTSDLFQVKRCAPCTNNHRKDGNGKAAPKKAMKTSKKVSRKKK